MAGLSLGVAAALLFTGQSALRAQVVVAGAVAVKGSPDAQDSVHVVQAGETLWAIAERYLGTGFAWRSVAERNGVSTATDRPLILIGQRLVIPPRPVAAGAVSPPGAPPTVPESPTVVAPDDAQPSAPQAPRIGLVTDADRVAARSARESRTVFHRELPSLDSTNVLMAAASVRPAPVPRLAEFEAAPHVVDPKWLEGAPRLIVHATAREREVAHLGDLVEVAGPRGDRGAKLSRDLSVGMRFAIVGASFPLGKLGVLAIPVGVLKVTKVAPQAPVLAEVVRQSGPVHGGLRLLPIAGTPADPRPPLLLEAPDVATTVVWVDQEARTPTLQDYLLLGLGSSRGVRAGDEFAVYAAKAGVERITVRVRVVRVDTGTSAAIIVRQFSPDVVRGMIARRVAKAQ